MSAAVKPGRKLPSPPDIPVFWPNGPLATSPVGEGGIAWHPKLPGVTVEIVFLTERMATEVLAAMPRNRKEKRRKTLGYYRNLVDGDWPFTADSICFNILGEAIDGEHRAKAVQMAARAAREAGIADIDAVAGMWTLIARGLEGRAQAFKDIGLKRSAGDHAAISELDEPYATASLARQIVTWQKSPHQVTPGSSTYAPTDPEVLATIAKYNQEPAQELTQCVLWAKSAGRKSRELKARPRVLAMCMWLFCYSPLPPDKKRDVQTGRQFMEWFISGADLPETHQISVLRKRFLNQGLSSCGSSCAPGPPGMLKSRCPGISSPKA